MKRISTLVVLSMLLCTIHAQKTPSAAGNNYIANRSPLAETPFTPLPIGSIKAEGWLLKQLQLQKDGLTGFSETLYNGADDLGPGNDWLGGSGNSWERAPYYTKGLVALAYVLQDNSLIDKAQKWINWSLNSQQASGYFGPSGNNDWWARMPMLYAICDFYDATGDERVIPFLTKYFQYQNNTINSRRLSDWGRSRAGDNIEIVFWLYNRTGDAFLLELADKLKSQAYDWTDIYTNNKFNHFEADFQPKHNVNVPQAMKMPAIYSQKSHAEADKDAFVLGREHLLCEHGQPEGMQSGNEMLAGKSAMTGLEMCSIVEQMQSCETAQMILGDASIGDQLEKVAFNALPGGLTKDVKGLQYYTQANQVMSRFGNHHFGQQYDNGILPGPYSGYGCCRFNFHHGWPYFVKTMWTATSDKGLAAMAYGPSEVTALVGDGVEVSIREVTGYPFDEQLTFTLTSSEPVAFPLKLRIPGWCDSPQVKVNGEVQNDVAPGAFFTIDRTWQNGDVVEIQLPMELKINDEVNNSVSVQRGPLVYSLKIQEDYRVRNDYGNGFKEYEVLPLSNWNYALVLDKANPAASIQVNKGIMPENPFIQATTPVTLTVSARKTPAWGYAFNAILACDPPYGPVETSEATEQITLVPFGAETLRATCLPVVGSNEPVTATFTDDFNDNDQAGWVNYGGSFFVQNGEYNAARVEGQPGSKSIQSSTSFSDFIYNAKVMVSSAGDGGLIFRADRLSLGADEYKGYYAGISSSEKNIVLGKANGNWTSLKTAAMDIVSNRWYQIRIEAKGSNIKIYVDNMTTPKIDFTDNSFSSGVIGVRSYNAVAKWDNIEVTDLSQTGIAEVKTSGIVNIYPNPVKDDLCLAFADSYRNSCRVQLFDSAGNLVKSVDRNKDETVLHINTKPMPSGVYLLNIKEESDAHSFKVVIQ